MAVSKPVAPTRGDHACARAKLLVSRRRCRAAAARSEPPRAGLWEAPRERRMARASRYANSLVTSMCRLIHFAVGDGKAQPRSRRSFQSARHSTYQSTSCSPTRSHSTPQRRHPIGLTDAANNQWNSRQRSLEAVVQRGDTGGASSPVCDQMNARCSYSTLA